MSGLSGSVSAALSFRRPSVDVPKLIHEVRRLGTSLKILVIVNARGLLEAPELRKALERTGRWKYIS